MDNCIFLFKNQWVFTEKKHQGHNLIVQCKSSHSVKMSMFQKLMEIKYPMEINTDKQHMFQMMNNDVFCVAGTHGPIMVFIKIYPKQWRKQTHSMAPVSDRLWHLHRSHLCVDTNLSSTTSQMFSTQIELYLTLRACLFLLRFPGK